MKKSMNNKTQEYKLNDEYDIEKLADILVEMKLGNKYIPKIRDVINTRQMDGSFNKKSLKNIMTVPNNICSEEKYKRAYVIKREGYVRKAESLFDSIYHPVTKPIESKTDFLSPHGGDERPTQPPLTESINKKQALWNEYLKYLEICNLNEKLISQLNRYTGSSKHIKNINNRNRKNIILKQPDAKK